MEERFKPLFEAGTAHDGLRFALDMISSSTPEEQKELLDNSEFMLVVKSSLQGLDECRRDHVIDLLSKFDKSNQVQAFESFSDDIN